MTEPIDTLKAHPLIREVTGANNRASLSSLFIPLIRLKKLAMTSVTTPDQDTNVLHQECTQRITPKAPILNGNSRRSAETNPRPINPR
jgi:hypothetical protein